MWGGESVRRSFNVCLRMLSRLVRCFVEGVHKVAGGSSGGDVFLSFLRYRGVVLGIDGSLRMLGCSLYGLVIWLVRCLFFVVRG